MGFLQSPTTIISMRIIFWTLAISVSGAASNSTPLNDPSGSNVPLKILPLGNSITFGYLSTDGNGFRKHLLDKITTNGPAQYIGSVRSGNMTDNHHEGHPGAVITQIGNFSRLSLGLQPNLILLMAGTNDMNIDLFAGATERLGDLIDMCSAACPDAVILVAQLTPAATPDVETRIEQFNPTVVSLAASREGIGMKIAAVDMPRFVKTADLKDGLHPNDLGYSKMADAWLEGIQQARSRGWFTAPVDGIGLPGTASAVSTTTTSSIPMVSTTVASPTNASGSTSQLLSASSSAPSNSSLLTASTAPTASSGPRASQTATNDASLCSGWGERQIAIFLSFAGLWISMWAF